MGEGAADALKAALTGKVSLETRRRLEVLLQKCAAPSAATLRHCRAVAALERIGTPEARVLLRTLADGPPASRLTVEARAALRRLPD
jgi:hypothetical protein